MLNAKKCSNLAEREGFEPSVPVAQYARLATPRGSRTASPRQDSSRQYPLWQDGSVARQLSHLVSPSLIESGKFSPP
jgi:hypothetical protein